MTPRGTEYMWIVNVAGWGFRNVFLRSVYSVFTSEMFETLVFLYSLTDVTLLRLSVVLIDLLVR